MAISKDNKVLTSDINTTVNNVNSTYKKYGFSGNSATVSTGGNCSASHFNSLVNKINQCINDTVDRKRTYYKGSTISGVSQGDILKANPLTTLNSVRNSLENDYCNCHQNCGCDGYCACNAELVCSNCCNDDCNCDPDCCDSDCCVGDGCNDCCQYNCCDTEHDGNAGAGSCGCDPNCCDLQGCWDCCDSDCSCNSDCFEYDCCEHDCCDSHYTNCCNQDDQD